MRREIKFRLLHESPGDPKKWIYGWPNVDGSSFDDVRNAFKNEMTYNNTCREIVRRYTDMRIEDLRKIFLLYDKNRKLKERIDMLEKGLAESLCGCTRDERFHLTVSTNNEEISERLARFNSYRHETMLNLLEDFEMLPCCKIRLGLLGKTKSSTELKEAVKKANYDERTRVTLTITYTV